MGKKVKIPIQKDGETTVEDGVKAESYNEDGSLDVPEFEDSSEDGDDEASEEKRFGLDKDFADRDVDFSDFEKNVIEEQVATESNTDGVQSSDEVNRLQQEVEEYKQKYLRTLADLENFRKRAQKERSDLLKYQGEKIVSDIVGVLDNLELALQHKDAEIENLRTGVEMIHQQFIDALDRWGIRAESALGQKFDPNKQNAINKVPAGDAEPGSVVAELKKTYYYKDKLLRVGEVIVAEAEQVTENIEGS